MSVGIWYDDLKNFAYSTVATAPSPATSGTSLAVTAGKGAIFPAVPFNAVIWPTGSNPTGDNSEVVRVTAISTDTLTITRAQESSSARTVVVGDNIAAMISKKVLDDMRPLKWAGSVAAALGDGNPGDLMYELQRAGNIAATPTNIGTGVARCASFILPFDLVVNKIRFYGVGATTNVFRVAIYRYSDLARLTAELAFTTAANAWGAAGSALAVTLLKDTQYFIAVSVNAIGTTAGPACVGSTVAATTGQIQTVPGSLPGNLDTDLGLLPGYMFQFAVTTGALPNPAATLAAQAAWTGGMPAFWLDNNNA